MWKLVEVTDTSGLPRDPVLNLIRNHYGEIGILPMPETGKPLVFHGEKGTYKSSKIITVASSATEICAKTDGAIYRFRKAELPAYVKINKIREFCISNDYFAEGSANQYSKLFQLVENGASEEVIAAVIVVCSELGIEDIPRIQGEIENLFER